MADKKLASYSNDFCIGGGWPGSIDPNADRREPYTPPENSTGEFHPISFLPDKPIRIDTSILVNDRRSDGF